jgi:membrane-associated phospholipid phosphatase
MGKLMAKENSNTLAEYNFSNLLKTTPKNLISVNGLIEAGKNILVWVIKGLFVFILSITTAYLFWYVRAWIPSIVNNSFKSYAALIDSIIFGVVPSFWMQQNFRSEILDIFLRWVWFSYGFVILFGSTFVFIFRAETKRHLLSVVITLSTGLLIHYLLPTEPPWMAIESVVRINGDHFSKFDKNLVAAMPSIHQAIICLLGCFLWNYGLLGKAIAIFYNFIMLIALVYLGEHYAVDSFVGIFIAITAWNMSNKIIIGFLNLKGNCYKWISTFRSDSP